MGEVSDIVQVTINTQAVTPSAPGFGIPAVMAYDAPNGQPEVAYFFPANWSTAMVAAGYTITSPTYLAVEAAFEQSPCPVQVGVIAGAVEPTKIFKVAPIYTNSSVVYELTVNGTEYTFTGAQDVHTAVAGLIVALGTISGITIAGASAVSTTIASGSNGVNVSTFAGSGTLDVASAGSFSSGTVVVPTSTGQAVITYTGTGSGTLTGCTTVAGTGTLATGGAVVQDATDTFLTLTATAAGAFFSVATGNSAQLQLTETTADAGITTDLNNAILYDNTWYALNVDAWGSKAIILAAGAWCQAQSPKKLLVTQTCDSICSQTSSGSDTTSVLYALNQLYSGGNVHIATIYAENSAAFSGIAWLGARLPYAPGSENWMFASLKGVPAAALTPTQVINIKAKFGNYYYTVGGVNITATGITAGGGGYLDLVRGADWLGAIIGQGIFGVLTSTGQKVAYTDPGIAQLENEVRACLDQAVTATYLAASPKYTVAAPLAADATDDDLATRTLNAITFTATAQGAINDAVVQGTVLL